MLLDWLICGVATWVVAYALNRTTFRDRAASRPVAWTLTTIMFFVSLVAMSVLQMLRFQAVSADLGFTVRPRSPFDAVGAFVFTYLFYSLLRKAPRRSSSVMEAASGDSPIPNFSGAMARPIPARAEPAPSSSEGPCASSLQPGAPNATAREINSDGTRPEEADWAEALSEHDGSHRRAGLWARAFAEARADESVAKALYLTYRAREFAADREAQRLAVQRELADRATTLDGYRKTVLRVDELSATAIVEFLRSISPDDLPAVLELRSSTGSTMLHVASREGYTELLDLLLILGADRSAPGPRGLLPHQIADRSGNPLLAKKLRGEL